ncbi:MAG: 30S ribosomal protein S9 [Acidobacteria bacterium]|jgi:small subunit ribosomal protein S9|nr:30S ribosomal protein S9 [Acidobacteriota bacterium]MCZ6649658.1 30S ribosomal protein S9 [Acidobacteriota bacterium]
MVDIEYYGTGKRKSAISRVFLRPGSGQVQVNKRPLDTYFPIELHRMVVRTALVLTETQDQFDVHATVKGGGISGQADAIRHGITRALLRYDADLKAVMKKEGLLTRDSRIKERKKYGQPGARKRFQFSKR